MTRADPSQQWNTCAPLHTCGSISRDGTAHACVSTVWMVNLRVSLFALYLHPTKKAQAMRPHVTQLPERALYRQVGLERVPLGESACKANQEGLLFGAVDIKSKAIPVSPVLHRSRNVKFIRNGAAFNPCIVKRVFVASSFALRVDSGNLKDCRHDAACCVSQEDAHGD